MENLISQVIAWADERNLLLGSDAEKETLKLVYRCGELTDCVAKKEGCNDAIGHCVVQMVIICGMHHVTFDECLKHTQTIKDERVTHPNFSTLLVFKTIGELAKNISTKKDIKAEIGYLLIYLTALAKSLQISIKECTESVYQSLKEFKGILFDGRFYEEGEDGYESAKAIIKSRKLSNPQ